MIHSPAIQAAIRFAVKTHAIYQDQRRKGNGSPYITHPIVVALILARVGADEDTVVAGILHDTIEDSTPEKKVSVVILRERFGVKAARIVVSVSEEDRSRPWQERKDKALEHVSLMAKDSLLVKSADVIANLSELLMDHKRCGDGVFSNFNAPKEKYVDYQLRLIEALGRVFPENPLREDLRVLAEELEKIKD